MAHYEMIEMDGVLPPELVARMEQFRDRVQGFVAATMERRDRLFSAAVLLTEPRYRDRLYEINAEWPTDVFDLDAPDPWTIACRLAPS